MRPPLLDAKLVRVAAKVILEGQGGIARALRVILVRDWRTEKRHDPVSAILVDGPLEAMDAVGEDPEEPIHDAVPLLGVDALGQLHRAFHVGEEYGDLLTLAFEGGAGGEDLLGDLGV